MTEPSTFYCNGFHFEREADGNLVIDPGRMGMRARFNRNELASIFAFMSPKGETAETWAAAKKFLGGEQPFPGSPPEPF